MGSHHIKVTNRASNIEYAIRDVVVPATKLEEEGHKIIKLNIGDPLAYPGLPTPNHMVKAFQEALMNQENGYSHSYGMMELRKAISNNEKSKSNGGWDCNPEDVYVCHGVTEALQIIFAAFLEEGDILLSPGPHYPPYLTYPQLYGGKTVEYRLKPNDHWKIDFEDLESKMNENVKLLVLINPNNPTGGVITEDELDKVIEITNKWPQCTIISDEIYDRLNFSNSHISTASRSKSVPVITLNGVSKVYYAPGWRIGYLAIHDPMGRLNTVRDGIERLLRSRLCASTPAQKGYLAGLNQDDGWMIEYLEKVKKQRDVCISRINEIDGLEVQKPEGAFYMFVKLTDQKWENNDKKFVLDLLHEEHVLLVHGSGFSPEFGKGHVRLVYLPNEEILNESFDRIDSFLRRHRNNYSDS